MIDNRNRASAVVRNVDSLQFVVEEKELRSRSNGNGRGSRRIRGGADHSDVIASLVGNIQTVIIGAGHNRLGICSDVNRGFDRESCDVNDRNLAAACIRHIDLP